MRGVAAAHGQGVVHRDLKPGNIFLCTDADGTVLTSKVLDFGIATMMGRARRESTALDPIVRMGTPTYMSPEAIQCSPDVDGRTDIYGFGVIMFEALTGTIRLSRANRA
jgi:serine/threonine protein kinase